MKSLTKDKKLLLMQYSIEFLIEKYYESDKESDKYFIKLRLLDLIDEMKYSPFDLIKYMELDYDKFEPFISLLKNIKFSKIDNNFKSSSINSFNNLSDLDFSPIKIFIVNSNNEGEYNE